MRDEDRPDLDLRTATTGEINEAMTRGAFDALREHKRAGVPAVTWDYETGRVVLVPPEEIVVPEEVEAEAVKSHG